MVRRAKQVIFTALPPVRLIDSPHQPCYN